MNPRARRLRRYRARLPSRVEYCFAIPTGQQLPPFITWQPNTHTARWGGSVITSEAIKAVSHRSAANEQLRAARRRVVASFVDKPIPPRTFDPGTVKLFIGDQEVKADLTSFEVEG